MPKGPLDDLLPHLSLDDIALMDDDLSRMAELAGRGEILSIAGGPILMLWGALFPLTSVAFIMRYVDLLPPWLPIAQIMAVVGYGGSLGLLAWRRVKMKSYAWQSGAMFTIWGCAGAALFIFQLGAALSHFNNIMVLTAFQCIIFAITTAVMGAAGRRRLLLVPAGGWMFTGFAMFFLDDVIARQMTLGGAAILFMLIPGLFLTYHRKSA